MSVEAPVDAPEVPAGGISDRVVLAVRPLSVVPEREEFIVGDPESSVYVVLPAVGVQVLDLLRAGRTLGEASAEARRATGEDVDVATFAQSLLELGFATPAGAEPAPQAGRSRAAAPWLRRCFSRAAWVGYAACALLAIGLFALRPSLFPRAADIFFLDTPVRSLAGLTVITYVLAAAHEGCHKLAARAEGVRARITVSRRLYFLALEIDLTGLWSLPRGRRYSALLAGMAFDALVLLALVITRFGDGAGWWQLDDGASRVLAAITFVEVAAIMSQCWIFARTDLYAVLITATGCVNLIRVNQLMMRRALRLITPAQTEELADAPERDRAVARWFRWISMLGLAAAAWFFVTFFAPATLRLLTWIAGTVAHQDAGSEHFWEALIFGLLILCPAR
jgi:putative peptide zinc metalloprotease protein